MKSAKQLISFKGLLIACYVALILPLIGIGITVTPMKNFQIPNFVTSVIYNNPSYMLIYLLISAILLLISIIFTFSFHYLILEHNSITEALINSYFLMRKNIYSFFKDFILYFIIRILALALLVFVMFGILVLVNYIGHFDVLITRTLAFLVYITSFEVIDLLAFLSIPLFIHRLTVLFYKYRQINVAKVDGDEKLNQADCRVSKLSYRFGLCLALILLLNTVIAYCLAKAFDHIFEQNQKYTLIAHRGGGNLGAENSLEGLKQAILAKAHFSEIDIQRTKDNHYIVHHDKTFKRLASVNKKAQDLTLAEIKQLKIKNEFETDAKPQEVATLAEMLDVAKGKIGLFIELKGDSADHKMVDDVVKMVEEKDMLKEVVLLSLDYSLIKYIEAKYPSVDTGYLYFFSLGKIEESVADYLIMEENEASENNIDLIKEKGKKAIVWTVNTKESIQRFINSNCDGIITDYLKDVKEALEKKKNRSELEIIFDSLFN